MPATRHCLRCSRLFAPPSNARRFCSTRCHLLHCIRIIPWGCWEWKSKQYGTIWFRGRFWSAHRAAHRIFLGEIPEGMHVCHRCDNKRCINPEHLYPGTRKQNMQDAVARNRLPRGERHYRATLNDMQVRVIRRLDKHGYGSQREIGRLFSVSSPAVSAIVRRVNWKHLP